MLAQALTAIDETLDNEDETLMDTHVVSRL